MAFYTSLSGSGTDANPYCGEISLATTVADSLNFPVPLSNIEITADADTKILLKIGAVAASAEGDPDTPIRGMTKYIGPSHPPVALNIDGGFVLVGIKNMGAVTAVFKFNAWVGQAS